MSGPGMIDIHAHLLPGLDDGPATWDESIAMARLAVEDGIGCMIATTHQLGAYGRNHGRTIRDRAAECQRRLSQQGVPLRVLPGAEIRIESGAVARIKNGELLTLADRGRHVLLELPADVYFPLDRVLADLHAAGMVAILAHPERNLGLRARPEILDLLFQAGCLFQITGNSILGVLGRDVQSFSVRLIQQGLVQFVASDAHGPRTRRPLLARVLETLTELAGEETALDLLSRNAACVIEGRDVIAARPVTCALPAAGSPGGKQAEKDTVAPLLGCTGGR